METNEIAPPLGITPEWSWRQARLVELNAAIGRYVNTHKFNCDLVMEWIAEQRTHLFWLQNYWSQKSNTTNTP